MNKKNRLTEKRVYHDVISPSFRSFRNEPKTNYNIYLSKTFLF